MDRTQLSHKQRKMRVHWTIDLWMDIELNAIWLPREWCWNQEWKANISVHQWLERNCMKIDFGPMDSRIAILSSNVWCANAYKIEMPLIGSNLQCKLRKENICSSHAEDTYARILFIASIFACQMCIRSVCVRVCVYLISLCTMSQKRQPVGVGFYHYVLCSMFIICPMYSAHTHKWVSA